MDFWETQKGNDLGYVLNSFFEKLLKKKQYAKPVANDDVGKYIEYEIESNKATFVKIVEYDATHKLVIMEK